MIGLWLRSPTFGLSGRLVRNPTSIRRGDVGLRPYPYCLQGHKISLPARSLRRSGSLLLYAPECVEGVFSYLGLGLLKH
jgi:hypothetical protein